MINLNIATERYAIVSEMSKEKPDETCKALSEAGKIKQVVNTYTAKTSRSSTKLTYIAEVEEA